MFDLACQVTKALSFFNIRLADAQRYWNSAAGAWPSFSLTLYLISPHTSLVVSDRADDLTAIARRVFTPQEVKENLAALTDLAKNAATYISLDTTAMLK